MPRPPRVPDVRQAVPEIGGKAQTALCPHGCGSYLEFTPDAIGRMRERCPSCDGVARRPSVLHPSLRATAQALVPVTRAGEFTLPPVAEGQLRCQRCARGVDGSKRFCGACRGIGFNTTPELNARRSATQRANYAAGLIRFPSRDCRFCLEPFAPRSVGQRYCDRHRDAATRVAP